MTLSTRRSGNRTLVATGYMRKCIQQTGGGTLKYSLPTPFKETLAARLGETLPPGATLVPIIGMPDQTHLSNLSGDKKAWPLYITLGYLPSTRRNRPRSIAGLLLALLPIPPKLSKSTAAAQHQRRINGETLQLVFHSCLSSYQLGRSRASILTVPTGRFRGAS